MAVGARPPPGDEQAARPDHAAVVGGIGDHRVTPALDQIEKGPGDGFQLGESDGHSGGSAGRCGHRAGEEREAVGGSRALTGRRRPHRAPAR
jgi:hypothetical protein